MTFRQYLRRIKGPTIKVSIAFFIIMMAVTGIFLLDLFGARTFLMEVLNEFTEGVSDIFLEDGILNLVPLVINNIRVCFVALGLGIIPFIYLPVIVVLFNAAIVGIILGLISIEGIKMVIYTFILGIVPHGIFELPAIFLATACGFLLSHTLTKSILRKEHDLTVVEVLKNSLKTLVFVCIPLMIVAGLIEVYITPRLLMMVM